MEETNAKMTVHRIILKRFISWWQSLDAWEREQLMIEAKRIIQGK